MVTSTAEIIFEARKHRRREPCLGRPPGRLVWVDIIGRTIHCLDRMET